VWLESAEFRDLALDSAEEDALKRVERDDRAAALHRALKQLSDDDRLILILYYLEDREYGEIQAITGLSYTVLKTRLARARKRLRDRMETALGSMDA
jgi:RNA polymerase sigma-70 factor (ECF subfamily)